MMFKQYHIPTVFSVNPWRQPQSPWQLRQSRNSLQKSSNMVPGLLLPKYLLAKLYVESGETEKAKTIALEILNSPVKVKSTATNEITNEMKNIVTPSSTEETQSLTENLINQRL
ncbi:MAG: hypothetical protein PWQ06_799 [Anaerophaga sp.]|nr:hypothetical protein [Anaerophaga sp.]MDN5290560.1 hypothetical protein [Anaerophaga sp.]